MTALPKEHRMIRKIAHPAGQMISFNAKYHSYSIGDLPLRSVSKVLDKCFPFDEVKVSTFVAKKTGQNPQDVVAGWRKQATLGKNVHALIESKLLGQPPPFRSAIQSHGDEEKYIPVAEKAVDKVLSMYDCVAVEQVIASPQLKVAGTIDFIGRNKKTGAILIADWKTSGSTVSSFRFGSFETPALGVLAHLPNAKFFRYGMQIMVYSYILRLEGYEKMFGPALLSQPVEYGIVQLSKDEEGKVVCEFKEVTPEMLLPPDDANETTIDELMNTLILGN